MLFGAMAPADPDYPERHPCENTECTNTVQFDDEPFCFTDSPDSGSAVPGYSYKAKHQK